MIGTASVITGLKRPASRTGCWLVAVAFSLACGQPLPALAEDPAAAVEASVLEFMRVHVPRGSLADVPLGNERYVPMSVREFEEAVARLSKASASRDAQAKPAGLTLPGAAILAETARYEAVVAADGSLSGRLTFNIVGTELGEMPLGQLVVARAEARTAAGTGDAVVFGRSDDGFAIAISRPGSYTCDWKAPAPSETADGLRFSLPLVPALHSTVTLVLPDGCRPIVAGAAARMEPAAATSVPEKAAATQGRNAWLIEVGPKPALDVLVVRGDPNPPALALWSELLIRGREVLLGVTVQPAAAWTSDVLELEKDASVDVVRIAMPEDETTTAGAAPGASQDLIWSQSRDRRVVTIVLPARAVGTSVPVVIEAVAPAAAGAAGEAIAQPAGDASTQPLPLIRAPQPRWAGGGMVLQIASTLSLVNITFEQCLCVTPEVAARWPLRHIAGTPLAAGSDHVAQGAAPPGVRPSRIHIEQQGPAAAVRVAVAPRTAEWDVARVTAIDLAPAVVLGRASCDIRVLRGEAFELTGRVAPGWIIDAVEAVDWLQSDEWPASRRRTATTAGEPLEWKVVRDGERSQLRIGLTVAATPARGLGLRITGHRAGAALGASFSSADIDMVCLDGEADGMAVIAFKTNPDTTIEIKGGKLVGDTLEPRLAALVEEAGVRRAWAAAGLPAPAWEARLVRRRPPLDVLTQVRIMARDDRLTESFTFECRPDTSELDALVIQFSEPMNGLLEWSLLPPATGKLTARRLEPAAADRREATVSAGVAESWMIEITPPVREPVTIRAVRTIPFRAPVPVPLAWVEAAVRHVGQVVVRDAGRMRSHVLNRKLGELPPRGDDVEQSSRLVAEFSFPASFAAMTGQESVAELIPGGFGDGDDARAWAWSETTTCWCHASGLTEYETLFDIENHGRDSVALTLPPGRRVQGILLDGARVDSNGQSATAVFMIELPAGRRRLQALVRTVAEASPGVGAWWIDPVAGAVDLPVLERTWRMLLPPELEIAAASAAYRAVGIESPTGAERLLGARLRSPPTPAAALPQASETRPAAFSSIEEGFSERTFVPAPGSSGPGGMVIVRTGLLTAAAILTGLVVFLVSLVASRGRPWLSLAICIIAALFALWVVSPYQTVARGAWWGAAVAVWLRSRRSVSAAPAVTTLLAALLLLTPQPVWGQSPDERLTGPQRGAAGAAADPLRVFMTPVDQGETALVPETLFRMLVRGGEGGAAAVRILGSHVEAGAGADEAALSTPWRLAIEVDADAGGMLVLAQRSSGSRWIATSTRLDGQPVTVRPLVGERVLQLLLPAAGRHRIEIDVEPAVMRSGDVESAAIDIPVAPAATLSFRPPADGGPATVPYRCECAPAGGAFVIVPPVVADGGERPRHDISRSSAVRLVRAIDPRATIAAAIRRAESRNDVFWDLDACRVTAVYEIDPGDEILRWLVVAADPRLALVEASDAEFVIKALEGNRFLIERRSPVRGPVRIEIQFRMQLVDPAGVFRVPEAWLEGVDIDQRTTRLIPSPSLIVQVALPEAAVALPPRDTDSALQTHAWFVEAARTADLQAVADGQASVRLTSERRRQDVSIAQSLAVRFYPSQTRMELQSRIDATSTALVAVPIEVPPACVIDRLSLFEEIVQPLEPIERGAIDLRWSRTSPGRLLAIVQRPRSGRFRLELMAHLPTPPAATGPLPLARVLLDAAAPLAISWNTTREGAAANRSARIFVDEAAPAYALDEGGGADGPAEINAEAASDAAVTARDRIVADGSAASPARDPGGPRVELADVQFNVEDRGRAWGLARFDFVTDDSVVRLQLPPGMRLFDAFIDGHALATGVPSLAGQANVWELRLHDVRWPRSLLVVFAGDLGQRLTEGMPFEVQPPKIVGLPCGRLLWTLQAPRGLLLRVAEPAQLVSAAAMATERAAALQRLAGDFAAALAAAEGPEQERLQDLVRLREEQAASPTTRGMEAFHAGGAAAATLVPAAFVVMNPPDRPLTIRAVRQADSTVPSRAIATLATLVVGGAALHLARRRPDRWIWLGSWFFPSVAGILGMVWLVALAPAWPGGLLLAAAVAAAARRWLGREPDHAVGVPVLTTDVTVTHVAVDEAATRASSITQTAPFPDVAAQARPPGDL